MYDVFKTYIEQQNKKYQDINSKQHEDLTEEEMEKLQIEKKFFIYDYSRDLSTLIINHFTEIKPEDTIAFDLVPYIVWMKISEKAYRIINKINQMAKEK